MKKPVIISVFLLLPLFAIGQFTIGPCGYWYVISNTVPNPWSCRKTVGRKIAYRSEIDTTVWHTIWVFKAEIPCAATDWGANDDCIELFQHKMAALPKNEFSLSPVARPISCPIYYVAPYSSRVKKSKIIRA